MKPLLLAILFGTPAVLHGQMVGISSTYSYSGSVTQTGYDPQSFSYSVSSDGSYGESSSGAAVGVSYTSAAGARYGAGISPGGEVAGLGVTAGTFPYVQAGGYVEATAQAAASFTFSVISPVSAVFGFKWSNAGPILNSQPAFIISGDSHLEFSLSSSTGGLLIQGGSALSSSDDQTLDLGILQPGEIYTLSASAFAHSTVTTGPISVADERVADLSSTLQVTPVPEPATYALVAGAGLLGFAFWRQVKTARPSTNQ